MLVNRANTSGRSMTQEIEMLIDKAVLVEDLVTIGLLLLPDEAISGGNLVEYIRRQIEWSSRTFGPGPRTAGLLAHIRSELTEIEDDPADVTEWIDVIILAIDGAWRAGHSPEAIVAALHAKQAKNEARKWPDWRTGDPNEPIEHNRDGEQ